MERETFENLVDRMETAAEKSGDAMAFWQQVALVLQIWRDCKGGWFPVVTFDPRYQPGLRDLEAASKRFGIALVDAANQRAFC